MAQRKAQDPLLSQDAEGDPDLQAEQEKANEFYKRQEDFYLSIAAKFELYDPLDGDTPAENNQALKTKEFLESIHAMPFLDG